jgi:Domain of unknown function (DUF4296)
MKQGGIAVVFFIVSLTACKEETRPPGVLAPAEFSKILVEVYLAEARINSTALQRDSAIKLFVPYEEKLFQQFELPDSVVRKTYQYYVDHPKQLELIYDSVIDTLSLREQKLRTKSVEKDSIKEKRIRKPKLEQ